MPGSNAVKLSSHQSQILNQTALNLLKHVGININSLKFKYDAKSKTLMMASGENGAFASVQSVLNQAIEASSLNEQNINEPSTTLGSMLSSKERSPSRGSRSQIDFDSISTRSRTSSFSDHSVIINSAMYGLRMLKSAEINAAYKEAKAEPPVIQDLKVLQNDQALVKVLAKLKQDKLRASQFALPDIRTIFKQLSQIKQKIGKIGTEGFKLIKETLKKFEDNISSSKSSDKYQQGIADVNYVLNHPQYDKLLDVKIREPSNPHQVQTLRESLKKLKQKLVEEFKVIFNINPSAKAPQQSLAEALNKGQSNNSIAPSAATSSIKPLILEAKQLAQELNAPGLSQSAIADIDEKLDALKIKSTKVQATDKTDLVGTLLKQDLKEALQNLDTQLESKKTKIQFSP